MVFVYIKDGSIIRKDELRRQKFEAEADMVIDTTFSKNANLIYEDGMVKEYANSRQYKIDNKEIGLKEENIKLKRQVIIERKRADRITNDYIRLTTAMTLLRQQAKNVQTSTNDMIGS